MSSGFERERRKGAAAEGGGDHAEAPSGETAERAHLQRLAARSDAYHLRHPELVEEFNRLTGGQCGGGAAGVSFRAVRNWQATHGVPVDGLIGPKTLAAARKLGGGKPTDEVGSAGAKDGKAVDAVPGDAEASGADEETKLDGVGGGEPHDAIVPVAFDAQRGGEQKAAHAKQPGELESGDKHAGKKDGDVEDAGDRKVLPPKDAAREKPGAKGGKHAHGQVAQFEALRVQVDQLLEKFAAVIAKMGAASAGGKADQAKANPAAGEKAEGATPASDMLSNLAIGEFVAAAKKIENDWPLLSPQERVQQLVAAANVELAREQVPGVHGKLDATKGEAEFVHHEWLMRLNKETFDALQLVPSKRGLVAETIFHESRHAEQSFKMARLLAGKGKSSLQIAKQLDIREDVAARAVAVPIKPDSAAGAQAQQLFDDKITHGKEHNAVEKLGQEVTAMGGQMLELMESIKVDASVDDQTKQRIVQEFESRRIKMREPYKAYRELSTEKDAYAAEAKVEKAFDNR